MPAPDSGGRGLFGCIARGMRNVRANWPLVAVQAAAGLVLLVVMAAGLLPLLAAFGVRDWSAIPRTAEDWVAWVERLGAELPALNAGLLTAASATSVVWLLAFVLFCFFQAGTYGVLFAGDRQAPERARGWRFYRTWRLGDFCGWGARDLWRYFWFLNLVAAVWLLVSTVALLVAVAALAGGEIWGLSAAAGIGCGGLLPVGFLGVATLLWAALGQTLLPRSELSVFQVSSHALRVLGRRLGGVAGLYLLAVLASVAIAIVFLPLQWGLDIGLANRNSWRLGLQVPLTVLEGLASSYLGLALTASLIALVRGELARPPARRDTP